MITGEDIDRLKNPKQKSEKKMAKWKEFRIEPKKEEPKTSLLNVFVWSGIAFGTVMAWYLIIQFIAWITS